MRWRLWRLVHCLTLWRAPQREVLIGAATMVAIAPLPVSATLPEQEPLFTNLYDVINRFGNDQGSPQKGGCPGLWCAAQPAPI